MDDIFHIDAAALVALIVLTLLIVAVATVTMMPTRKPLAPVRGGAHHLSEDRRSEVRGFLVALSAALRSSEGASTLHTNLTPDALDETRRRVALVALPSSLHDVDMSERYSLCKEQGRLSNKTFERVWRMIREGHDLLGQGRVKEGARLLIDAAEAAEAAATADHTDARPHWLLAFAWFGLGSAAEHGNDASASAVSYKRAFFRMAKACERQLLAPGPQVGVSDINSRSSGEYLQAMPARSQVRNIGIVKVSANEDRRSEEQVPLFSNAFGEVYYFRYVISVGKGWLSPGQLTEFDADDVREAHWKVRRSTVLAWLVGLLSLWLGSLGALGVAFGAVGTGLPLLLLASLFGFLSWVAAIGLPYVRITISQGSSANQRDVVLSGAPWEINAARDFATAVESRCRIVHS